jgi:hypothetical protein
MTPQSVAPLANKPVERTAHPAGFFRLFRYRLGWTAAHRRRWASTRRHTGSPIRLRIGTLWTSYLAIGFLTASVALAQDVQPTFVLFQNVRIFDGKGSALSVPSNVLVRGNKIERISAAPIQVEHSAIVTTVNGGGRTLMPGLIDAHVSIYNMPNAVLVTADPNYQQIRQAASARYVLLAGFTSVRDMGGPVFGLKRAIDEGLVDGPRIWPSGAMISQTSGHGEYRLPNQLPGSVVREPPPASVSGIKRWPMECQPC